MVEPGDILREIYSIFYGRPMNFSFIDDSIAGSARLMSPRDVRWLREAKKIDAILSVTEKPLPQSWTSGFDYKCVPVKNHVAPTMDQLRECVDFLLSETSQKKKTVVHCAAGKGRTGTVLASYLCAKYGDDPSVAIGKIRKARPGSIERNAQEKAVSEFSHAVLKKGRSD